MVDSGRSFPKYASAVGKSTLKMSFKFSYPYGRGRYVWDLTELVKIIQPNSCFRRLPDKVCNLPAKTRMLFRV